MVWRPATMTRNYVLKATFFLSSLYFAQAQQGGEFQDMIAQRAAAKKVSSEEEIGGDVQSEAMPVQGSNYVALLHQFHNADTDNDGKLYKDEFINYFQSHPMDSLIEFHDPSKGSSNIPSIFRGVVSDTEFLTASFWKAFLNSLAMILVCEIGDKTFFIGAIMAMQHPPVLVFTGAFGALIVMTILSSLIGFALPNLLPKQYTHYAAAVLFLYFGLKLVYDACQMEAGEVSEELQEVEEDLSKSDHEQKRRKRWKIISQAFILTFLAEWGDRSQIATIALAAAKDPYGVTLGGILGHSFCTGLAVIGGRLLAARISEKTVAYVGGITFFIFAVHAFIVGPEQ
jgi:putative Ca2+/H+ antiporter (TMEM165/GDT1 family)